DGLLGRAEVAASHAAGDDVRNAAALLGECGGANRLGEKHLAKLDLLEYSDTHDCSLRVVAPAETVDEAGREGDNVFEGTPQGHARDVRHHADVQVRAME